MTLKQVVTFVSVFVFSGLFWATTTFAASHTVKTDETLKNIAEKYDTTELELMALNELETNAVEIDFVLKLPAHIKNKPVEEKDKEKEKEKEVKTLTMISTAYTAYCKGCTGFTKTGINLRGNSDIKVVAVDPKVIPLGTKVWVEGYGEAVAGDTGGSIKGNKIDIFVANRSTAYQWGRRTVKVKVYES